MANLSVASIAGKAVGYREYFLDFIKLVYRFTLI